jgi:hypothetical protein
MTTIEILRTLQSEVGSRRAGTGGEHRAQEWLMNQCKSLGLPVELDEFAFIGSEHYRPLLQLFYVTWIGVSIILSFVGRPAIGAVGILLLFIYMNFLHKKLDVRLARTQSQNVIAGLHRPISEYVADSEKGSAFLVCAHYDTPRNLPRWYSQVRDLMRFLAPVALLGIVGYAAFMILRLTGLLFDRVFGWGGLDTILATVNSWIGWLVLIMAAPLLLLMLFLSLTALVRKQTDSPGADDNGSGTALVLELARRLKENPPANSEVFFAWWGAEELGLFGSRQFVRRFHDQLDASKLYLINADCVGVGELLTIHTGQGMIRRRATDPTTVERIERIADRLGIKTIRAWESIISGGSSDHAEWVDRGYRHAVSLLRENYRPLTLPARLFAAIMRIPDVNQLELDHIHTPDDTIEMIDPQILEDTTDLAEACIREIAGENEHET